MLVEILSSFQSLAHENAFGSLLSSGLDLKTMSALLLAFSNPRNLPFMLTEIDVVKIPGVTLRASFHSSIARLIPATKMSTSETLFSAQSFPILSVS